MNTKTRKKTINQKLLPLMAVTLLSNACIASGAYEDIIMADNPVAYYRLEESQGAITAVDSTTNHLDATYTYNGESTFPQLGNPGIDTNSISFDGGGTIAAPADFVTIPYSPLLAPTNADGIAGAPFSAEAWVEANTQPGNYSVPVGMNGAYAGSGTYANASGWNFYQSPGPASYWIFNMKPSPFLQSSALIVPFQWYHLVGTYDGTNAYFYINGVLVTSGAASSGYYADNGYTGLIGAGVNIGFTPFSGGVDEVAIYNYALSPAQVSAHYLSGTNSFRAVETPPGFASKPASTTNYAGTKVTFSTIASGSLPLHYQWNRENAPIFDATNSSYSFICAYPGDDNATFSVTVSNDLDSTNSGDFTLTVLTNLNVINNPFSITRNTGSKAAFRVVANGALPLSYQWFISSNSVQSSLAGATNDTLWLSHLTNSLDGTSYFCRVSNPFVTSNSTSATLSVQPRGETVPLTSRYAKMILADDPVAYWRLDEADGAETAVDAVGSFDGEYLQQDFDGTFVYDVTAGIPDETDGAVRLDNATAPAAGGGAIVNIPYALELNPVTGPWSAEAWVQPASLDPNTYHTVISSMYNPDFGNDIYGWLIYQTPDAHFVFNMFNGSAGGSFNPGTAITAGTWYHLVITDDLTNQYFYVNGVLISQLSQSFGFIANGVNGDSSVAGGNTVFGQRVENAFGAFDGAIDDVAFYNYTLTPQQISNHYHNSIAAPILYIETSGNEVKLTWTTGTLLSSPTVNGTYTQVDGAVPPYTVSPQAPQMFYRLSVP